MRDFEGLLALAISHHGSLKAVEEKLPAPLPPEQLAAIDDSRWLAAMARSIFSVGFSQKVVDAKWPGFEAAFDNFDSGRVSLYSGDDLDRLVTDKRIIRNGQKIRAVLENAIFLAGLARDHGSAAHFFADWPSSDIVGLWQYMKKHGSRLGGFTGQFVLRRVGKDTMVMTRDVVRALVREGVVDKEPSSQSALKAVQQAFNGWADQAGRPLCQVSRILALSVGP